MRPTNINELKRLLAEATQWTWEAHADMSPNGKHRRAWITADGKRVADTASCNLHLPHDRYPQDAHNAALIASAVNALPALLAHIEAAQQREQVLRDELTRLRDVVSAVEYDSIDAALADTEVQP